MAHPPPNAELDLPLGDPPETSSLRSRLRGRTRDLAGKGLYFGTSSWKYPGWMGQIYTRDRYVYRGRFSETRFQRQCLAEYAEVFPAVCVDASYYQFPRSRSLEDLISAVPPAFRFGFKVTNVITLRTFPRLDRFGPSAGKVNPEFLNADLFQSAFLSPLEPYRTQVGILMFEFSQFGSSEFSRGPDFADALEPFLAQLPPHWPYGIEIRNDSFLHPDYFALLRRHNVAHVYNNWTRMPSIAQQLRMDTSQTHDTLTAARFLLKPGRTYENAVKSFSPYDRTREVSAEGRAAGQRIAADHLHSQQPRQTFVFVNNRFEGNAPGTIAAMLPESP